MSTKLTDAVLETYQERPKVAVLMSGAGTNAVSILEDKELHELYDFSAISTDNPASNARCISVNYGLRLLESPAEKFRSTTERQKYFSDLAIKLHGIGVRATMYAGFMKVSTADFCEQFPGVNVHPADLSILGDDGLPKYRGMDALKRMRENEGSLRSTVHIVDIPVDSGLALAISDDVTPIPGETNKQVHRRLKSQEHYIYPEVLRLLGRGQIKLAEIPLHLSTRGLNDC